MTAAEKLRQEVIQELPFTKQELISEISELIRYSNSGRAYFICDKHINETKIRRSNTIQMKHEKAAIDFALSEGFSVQHSLNKYGVRHIVFTL